MSRGNRMVRVRRYDQWPQERMGWFIWEGPYAGSHASGSNPHYRRDMRMQSWRRPI